MKLNEFKPGIIQPGMESVIEAGDTLEITDEKGQVFAVTAKESKATVEFCQAFDVWLEMRRAGIDGPIIETALSNAIRAFDSLPLRVRKELPSFKTLGVKV